MHDVGDIDIGCVAEIHAHLRMAGVGEGVAAHALILLASVLVQTEKRAPLL
jgi:hypothetical protein